MTETPDKVSKIIRLKARAHNRLNELLDRFQALKWGGPPDSDPAELGKVTHQIQHLLAISSCCQPPNGGLK